MNIPQFIIGIIFIVSGALMIADSVFVMLGQNVIFFEGVNNKFEFIVGLALVVLGASNIDPNKVKNK